MPYSEALYSDEPVLEGFELIAAAADEALIAEWLESEDDAS